MRELTFETLEIVELGDPRGDGDVDRLADVAGTAHALTVRADHDQRLVHAAVVAVAVEQDLGPTGQRPRQPDGPPVGVGGGQREAPAFEPEPAGELGAHPLGVLGGQHRRDATLGGDALLYGGHGRLGRVPRHRAGVAEREVDVLEAVDVPDAVAQRPVEVDREAPGVLVHPGHRHPAEQMVGTLVGRSRSGVPGKEVLPLAGVDLGQPGAFDHGRLLLQTLRRTNSSAGHAAGARNSRLRAVRLIAGRW